jgi:hypothetical protein
MSDQTPTRKPVVLTAAADPDAPAIKHTRIAQAPAGDPVVIDSTATIGERLAVLLRLSTILAAGALEA